jgi:hypothetical protein
MELMEQQEAVVQQVQPEAVQQEPQVYKVQPVLRVLLVHKGH